MAYAAAPAVNRRLELWFDGPQEQRRWTVLLRWILAIPQGIVLFFLEIALLIVAVIGWFGALFMGRLPDWVHRYNSGFVRWFTRYAAYAYLLTDEYPPFEFDDLPYPARPILPPPGTLNRAAVFFRSILVVPAQFFQAIVAFGLFIPMVFVWIIMVFTGRMPRSFYWAYSSWVRYQARVTAYLFLLTPEYPWGMLGDRGFAAPPPFPPPFPPPTTAAIPAPYPPPAPFPQPPAPPATGTEPASSPGDAPAEDAVRDEGTPGGSPGSFSETPGEGAIPVPSTVAAAWPPPPPPGYSVAGSTPPPPPWDRPPPPPPPSHADSERSRLVLPNAARTWLVFSIVWGSIVMVGLLSVASVRAFNNETTAIRNANTVVNDFNASKDAIDTASVDASRCTTVSCLRASHLAAARSLDKFDSDLAAMNLSCTAVDPAQVVESDLTQLATAFTDLANSSNVQTYRATVQRSNLVTLLNALPNDTNTLLTAIRSSSLASFCAS